MHIDKMHFTSVIVWIQFSELYWIFFTRLFLLHVFDFSCESKSKINQKLDGTIFATFTPWWSDDSKWNAFRYACRGAEIFVKVHCKVAILRWYSNLLHYESTLSHFASNYHRTIWCVIHMCSLDSAPKTLAHCIFHLSLYLDPILSNTFRYIYTHKHMHIAHCTHLYEYFA